MRPLKVGVQLPETEYVARWPELKAMAQAAESAGFDSLWVGDHLLYRADDGSVRGPWEAWTLLAALAAVTSRVELGPLVAATSFHSPAMIAKKAATLDEISGGRLILGLGAGWNEPDYTAFGFAYDHRAARFEEAFRIIRTLLREGSIDFTGEYYSVRDSVLVPRGPRTEGPPLMIGSIGPRVLRATLPHVDSWNAWYSWFGNDPERLRALLATVDEACAALGRDPATLERTVAVFVQFPGGDGRPSLDKVGEPMQPLEGSPDAMADRLRAFAAVGVSHVQLVVDPITRATIDALAPVLEALDR